MLSVLTLWDPTTVPANWGLKAMDLTASVSDISICVKQHLKKK